jgi:type IV pilus assembly protein PilB
MMSGNKDGETLPPCIPRHGRSVPGWSRAVATKTKRLGELLVETGLLSEEDLARALAEQRLKRCRLGEAIAALHLATEEEIAQALSLQIGVPFINMAQTPVEPQAVELIPEKVARRHLIMPVMIERGNLHIAMADPLSFEAVEDVRFASGYATKPAIATRSDILWAIDQHYHLGASLSSIVKDIVEERAVEIVPERSEQDRWDAEDLRKKSEAAPVIRMVDLVIAGAVDQGASDIHIEPMKTVLRIRNRIDGLLRKSLELPKWVQGAVISRIKIMASMDIAEKRLPQDGRITVRVGGKVLDLRVSSMPALCGEKVVIRILDAANARIPLDAMGLAPPDLSRIEEMVRRPQGIVLVTGPTGSGKTTTLYAMLNRIRNGDRNIATIEDPVEYEMSGINQVAAQERIGLSFSMALRAMLRQDPDVIMVGEMRDLETTTIAMQAALTGHLVLSTVHTNSTVATITRLRNLGVPSYLIASTIAGIVAQRLVRVICAKCRVRDMTPERDLKRFGLADGGGTHALFRGEGCPACGGTGYRGRTGVFEILTFTPQVRDMVNAGASESDIRQHAVSLGMVTLARAALDKVRGGETTLEEIYRVIEAEQDFGSICPACGATLESGFIGCPACGHAILSACPSCLRTMSSEWRFCPYCHGGVSRPLRRQPVL